MIRGVLSQAPRFLTLDEVLSLHETAIDLHGGSHGVRDHGLLESALGMARQGFSGTFAHEFPFEMAAAYLFHICKNHPFVDGNKRTSLTAAVTFLDINGWTISASEDDVVRVVLAVAENAMDKTGLAQWFESISKPRPSIELREFFQRLGYTQLASMLDSIAAGPIDERVATVMEASQSIPSIMQANFGAIHAEEHGDKKSADILRQHTMLLTAIHRIAEEQGYEW